MEMHFVGWAAMHLSLRSRNPFKDGKGGAFDLLRQIRGKNHFPYRLHGAMGMRMRPMFAMMRPMAMPVHLVSILWQQHFQVHCLYAVFADIFCPDLIGLRYVQLLKLLRQMFLRNAQLEKRSQQHIPTDARHTFQINQ